MTPRAFLEGLREEVRTHPAVNHPFLAKLATHPYTREDYRVYGAQHYPLVHVFTRYLEHLLLLAPDGPSRLWIARVLVDEYGEGSDGQDHPTLYLNFLRAAGVTPAEALTTPLSPSVVGFVADHLRLTREGPFLYALGAVGPGHEWAIPHMFPPLVTGLRRAGFGEEELGYFTLHLQQDEDHGAWLEEALARFCVSEAEQRQVREGCLRSLALRQAFWSGIERRIVAFRQPHAVGFGRADVARRGAARVLGAAARVPGARGWLAPVRRRLAPSLSELLAA